MARGLCKECTDQNTNKHKAADLMAQEMFDRHPDLLEMAAFMRGFYE